MLMNLLKSTIPRSGEENEKSDPEFTCGSGSASNVTLLEGHSVRD